MKKANVNLKLFKNFIFHFFIDYFCVFWLIKFHWLKANWFKNRLELLKTSLTIVFAAREFDFLSHWFVAKMRRILLLIIDKNFYLRVVFSKNVYDCCSLSLNWKPACMKIDFVTDCFFLLANLFELFQNKCFSFNDLIMCSFQNEILARNLSLSKFSIFQVLFKFIKSSWIL